VVQIWIQQTEVHYFANNDWDNKGMEKIIERVGTLKKMVFNEIPKELSLI